MNDAAAGLGIKYGMTLADARAMHPSLYVHNIDHAADIALLEAAANWCDRYTPLVALDAPDGLMLDVGGCAHLFGGESAMRRDVIARLARQAIQARAALADTPGCAWAMARFGDVPLVPTHGQHDALLALPLAALRIDRTMVSALAQAGLKLIADVTTRPRAPLAARFGQDFLRRLDQALGYEDETITPRLPVPSYVTEKRFPEPIALQTDVLGTIEQLARELSHVMERHAKGARLLQVALFRTDGKVHRIEVGAGQPLREPELIQNLFIERLNKIDDQCDPGFGYDVIRLSAITVERLEASQIGLAPENHVDELKHLIDRLTARFGSQRVTRQLPRNTHIPEFAAMNISAQLARDGHAAAPLVRDRLIPARPLRLFARPEPIETVAEVPDGSPSRFHWRQVSHEVAAAEGPERIAMEWWRDGPGRALTRDYFHVESKQGMRVWLYREGLYGRETPQPRWFVHGLFA
jgi:protein ImuB